MPVLKCLRLSGLAGLVILALVGCDGGSGADSSSVPPPDPGVTRQDLLVYQSTARDGVPSRLYKLTRGGESTLLSGYSGEAPVAAYLVSPDARQVAYRYRLGAGQSGLAIVRVDTGEVALAATVAEELDPYHPFSWQWLPDSSGLVYALFDDSDLPVTLWLARPGDEQPVQLIGTEDGHRSQLKYAVSADGSRLAAVVELLDPQKNYSLIPLSASLYLLDLVALDGPVPVDTATGEANSYRLDWSPYRNDLLYQRRLQTDIVVEFRTLNYPKGPLVLLAEEGASRPIHEDYTTEGILPLLWLAPERVVVALGERFDVVGTDGGLQASHGSTGAIVPSPDGRRLAFLDWTTPEELDVYRLDVDTGDARSVGPGSSFAGLRGSRINSDLHWSPDGSWLVWDHRDGWEPGAVDDGYYAHSVTDSHTRLLTGPASRNLLSFVGWLPQGNVLQYLSQGETGQPATVTDLDAGSDLVVAPECMLGRWLSNRDILGKRCTADLYLSRLGRQGSIDTVRLLARNVEYFVLSANQQTVVILPGGGENPGTPDYVSPNWQLYDLSLQQLVELEGTAGTFCCGTLLQ